VTLCAERTLFFVAFLTFNIAVVLERAAAVEYGGGGVAAASSNKL